MARIILMWAVIVTIGLIILTESTAQQDDIGKVIDCKILSTTKENKSIQCDKDIILIKTKDWPEDWNDTKEVGMLVKFKIVDKDFMIPLKSCAARAKDRLKEYESRGMGQMQRPTNLPVDKDCQ